MNPVPFLLVAIFVGFVLLVIATLSALRGARFVERVERDSATNTSHLGQLVLTIQASDATAVESLRVATETSTELRAQGGRLAQLEARYREMQKGIRALASGKQIEVEIGNAALPSAPGSQPK